MFTIQLYSVVILWNITFLPVKSLQLNMKRCATSRKPPQINEETKSIKQLKELLYMEINPAEICEMKVSNGSIISLPNGLFRNFSSLEILSLPGNNIHKISADAFLGLVSLKNLDLTGNPIEDWNTSGILSNMPKLKTLDMTQSSSNFTSSQRNTALTSSFPRQPIPWKHLRSLLTLPQLEEIRGINWSPNCLNCSLIKSTNTTLLNHYKKETSRFMKGYACRAKITSPSLSIKRLANHGFIATCVLSNHKCYESEVKVVVKAPCRETTLSVMYVEFFLGPLAIILNIIVIGTVVTSKRLRRHNDMILVTNIAIGDLCNGVYSIVIVSIHATKTFQEMETFAQLYCSYIGSFWILGLSLSVSFSLVLTIERFKCVVRIRNRQSQMGAVVLLAASFGCWVWSLSATILPGFGIGYYNLNTYCIPVFPVASIPVQFYYSMTVSGASGLMYLATIPLYIKMYVFVRKSSKNMRVRADIELAKRVFTLVLTNVVFFLVPVIISIVFARVKRDTSELSREVSEVLNAALPLTCLSVNSVLNPVLYSFRSRMFRNEASKWKCRIRKRTVPTNFKPISDVRSAYVITTHVTRVTSQSTV